MHDFLGIRISAIRAIPGRLLLKIKLDDIHTMAIGKPLLSHEILRDQFE
jgi:hypothetical protein